MITISKILHLISAAAFYIGAYFFFCDGNNLPAYLALFAGTLNLIAYLNYLKNKG